ncbi:YpdA family putative bacillithiol disulfide reductase [Paenibacillus apiarius]|uniref:YpdA family putative bacillithiol disulfide reductase n=1 Tax=Paenibacillus apiarius TaxID=46240 RepID=UPI00197F26EF|nr:YpdA family putative bacillithiol disulfide reductase [Paenibacillus apiarius]MBN3522939.1 YpdA family putative bacillithiol disulfide reductase [Paenibacillus apiarius]
MEQAIVIGAGPCGLSAAIELQRIGLKPLVIEKHCLVHSIYRYPTHLQFFSTPELLEIGSVPFTTPHDKPFRHEALVYYRKVAEQYQLRVCSYEEATHIQKEDDGTFKLHTKLRNGSALTRQARFVVIATGYFDHPNLLGIPGESLPHVTHYFQEAHPYAGMNVIIIGGNNSAVDASLELLRAGANVTVVYRGHELSDNIKPWVRPIFESMIAKDRIHMRFSSQVVSIEQDQVHIQDSAGNVDHVTCDFVLALTGFRPDRKLLTESGVELQDDREKPVFHENTMETNVPGLYVAGVIASGRNANEVFIETGRHHGRLIAEHIDATLGQ